MNENTVEDIEIIKCERSHLIDSLRELIELIDMMAPDIKGTAGYCRAKNSLEKNIVSFIDSFPHLSRDKS